MVGKFWQGLLWGSIMGTVAGAMLSPMCKRYHNVAHSADAVHATARTFARGARRARKRFIKALD